MSQCFSPLHLSNVNVKTPSNGFAIVRQRFKEPNLDISLRFCVRNVDQAETETMRVYALARSKMWRHSLGNGGTTDCFLNDGDPTLVPEFLDENGKPASRANPTLLLNLQELAPEAERMTFQTKLDETLVNLYRLSLDSKNHGEFWLPYAQGQFQKDESAEGITFEIRSDSQAPEDDGRVYAAHGMEVCRILEQIRDSGFIKGYRDYDRRHKHDTILRFVLTASGYAKAEALARAGSADPTKGFLIRRYQLPKEHENALTCVVDHLKKMGFTLEASWEDEANNQKLDEYIFRQIKESAFVVAEVPPKAKGDQNSESTNVGLEVGYALGIGRTVIAIQYQNEENKEVSLPFDLVTAVCSAYGETPAPEELRRILARVQNASEEVKFRTGG